MLTSQFLLATQKEIPADAELISHQLMIRAGLIRKVASGLYTWLPMGFRVLKKVEQIVREEMEKAGALELLMPAVQPAELWIESGRWEHYGKELLRIKDRHDRDFCFGPTHEEVITTLMKSELTSYKQLPLNCFQIQTKFRDEIRPRFGVMRSREFIMKDAYSFHLNKASLEETYHVMKNAYTAIFTRLGLKFRAVLADTGQIGGAYSHEFQVLAESGEDVVVYSDGSDYAANLERAEALSPVKSDTAQQALEKIHTPGLKTIQDLFSAKNIQPNTSVKTLIVKGKDVPLVALILRGDHTLNAVKAEKCEWVSSPLTFASEADIQSAIGCSLGSIGPLNLPIPFIVDKEAAVMNNFCCGANEDDVHFINANWHRDAACDTIADLRNVIEGDSSPDGKGILRFARGIEVGHIFQLGDKYSRSMNLTVLDEKGKSQFVDMGCYGIGVTRIVAAAIEQNHDAHGILWPKPMAPFQVIIIPMQMHKSYRVREAALNLYEKFKSEGVDVLLDDRQERPGVMFATADLIGIPHRFVIGEKGLDQGTIEYKARNQAESAHLTLEEAYRLLE